MIKLFGWEHFAEQKIAKAREEELKWIWKGLVRVHLLT